MFARIFTLTALLTLTATYSAFAQSTATPYSSTTTGQTGLNTIPSARMDETGTIKTGLGVTDSYWHGFIGLQITNNFNISLRQTAEISNPAQDPDRFYPGIDGKFLLAKETAYAPALAVGIQSATGHARMGGEYLTASKRYKNFDFTLGLGWGRYGSAFQLDNPLGAVASHFDKDRNLDGEMPVEPSDWFTGEKIGLFGGVEYFTPIDGLSLKADLGADHYEAEKATFAYDAPAPWSIGANYNWQTRFADINTSIAAQGTERIMARLSLSQNIKNWFKPEPDTKTLRPDRPFGPSSPLAIQNTAKANNINLHDTSQHGNEITSVLSITPNHSTPAQIRTAAIHIANAAGPEIETISITPAIQNIEGPQISLNRTGLEQAVTNNQKSAEEIWHAAEIKNKQSRCLHDQTCKKGQRTGFVPFRLILDEQFSLAEEDYGVLHRTSLITKIRTPRKFGFMDSGFSLRLNLTDNLDRMEKLRPQSPLPVRSNENEFAHRFASLDEAYTAVSHSFNNGIHIMSMAGYLEEMYAGAGAEILYRPLNKRFTLGAETYIATKRDPDSSFNLGLTADQVLTGFLTASYDIPNHDITLTGKAGRFLAEDTGAQIGFEKNFSNGAKLAGHVTLSNTADYDLFGGATDADHRISLTLPLGGIKYIPDFAEAAITQRPFGRDIGQSLNKPQSLYDMTEPLSMPHLIRNWDDITP